MATFIQNPWVYDNQYTVTTTGSYITLGNPIPPAPPNDASAVAWLRSQVEELCGAGRAAL